MAHHTVNPPAPGPSLTIPARLWQQLQSHLFADDRTARAAVILAGWTNGPRGLRLLARELVPAQDHTDYGPGTTGHHALAASFVRDNILRARDENLAYIAVHNHSGTTRVRFSPTDLASHERGYPALTQISNTPVCGLVLTPQAAAGDLFHPDGTRTHLAEVVIPANNLLRLRPQPAAASPAGTTRASYDRQVRIFGDLGQQTFQSMRAAVIGLGGVGTLITEYLARLGIGHLVLIDDDTVDETNLPRLTGATAADVGRPKTALASRLAQQAQPDITLTPLTERVEQPHAQAELRQCDWLFLAADGAAARHFTNAAVQQHLIPATQAGVKIPVRDGTVGQIHAVTRLLLPGAGCLWCDGLINPTDLAVDMHASADRAAAHYVPDTPAASVIPLNALAAAEAVSHFMHAVSCLHHDDLDHASVLHRPRTRTRDILNSRTSPDCRWCSPNQHLALGDRPPLNAPSA
ncbi:MULTISPECIES: ThiF family adenylyltransferase [unclassified Streptomyces]|uniref:ThiF family adenylyltransferase n=1 Tax=unclassified Streptomyces TaxID=2593676 RepID=UPI0004CB2207|nr:MULTISPECIES: ThiF family adenylyltransferase [unclassified Streptomyces]KOV96345.1 thiamine biosynthesis protein ThiF [Streptomyces sp. NRRL WC-3723]